MIDDALQQTGQDFVDQGLNELKKFSPASRITKADKENDNKSTQRKLDRHLVLLLNETLGLYFFCLCPSCFIPYRCFMIEHIADSYDWTNIQTADSYDWINSNKLISIFVSFYSIHF